MDGNVLRVMTRLLASAEDILLPATRKRIAALLREQYPSGEEAALLTEGIMELGETLCIPNGEARCGLCPLRRECLACLRDEVDRYPVKSPPRERRIQQRTVLLLRCGGRWAIRRRESRGLLAGLWEFPNVEGWPSEEELRESLKEQGARILSCRACTPAKHVFTHVEWQMQGWLLDCAEAWGDFVWASPEEIAGAYSLPTAFRVYRAVVEDADDCL